MVLRTRILSPLTDTFTKVVVDIARRVLSYGCELHIDCAEELIADGSRSEDLWGANVYPEKSEIDFISLINVRPAQENRSMDIAIPEVRRRVEEIIRELLPLS